MSKDINESAKTHAQCGAVVTHFSVDTNVSSLQLAYHARLSSDRRVLCLVKALDRSGELVSAEALGLVHSAMYDSPYFYLEDGEVEQRLDAMDSVATIECTMFDLRGEPVSVNDIRLMAEGGAAKEPKNSDAGSETDGSAETNPMLEAGGEIHYLRGARSANSTERLVPLQPGVVYSHVVRLQPARTGSDSTQDEGSAKAALLRVSFFDRNLAEIASAGKGWSHSEKFGAFRYLSSAGQGENVASVRPPEGAAYYGYSIVPWDPDADVVMTETFEPVGYGHGAQLAKLNAELDSIGDVDPSKLLLVYTGTTRIGEKNRANRSMKMAELMARRGWTVVFVYYRSVVAHSIMDPQPTAMGEGRIVQIPNDLFQNFMMRVARMGRGCGTAIMSIPDPASVPLCHTLSGLGWKTIYEARDDWEEFARVGAARWYDTAIERELCRHCDLSLAVSPPLRAKCIRFGVPEAKALILANGAGQAFAEHYAQNRDAERGTRTKIGYFGHLTTQWFDWPALVAAARAHPDHDFEIIGHGQTPPIDEPNIVFLGAKSHEEIIPIAREWDIGLIPFVPGKLANAVDPIKIYEYACLRLKTVSIFMEQIADYPNTFLYRHSDQLSEAIDTALAGEFDERANDDFARNISWDDRMVELEALIEGIAK